jgi:hypothetical protein
MSLTLEKAGLKAILITVLTGLVPAAGRNVYTPAPEMPNGVYEGTYPYLMLAWAEYSLTAMEAAGGAIRRTDENRPNLWDVLLVDQLVSESGTTLAATDAFLDSFVDGVNDIFNIRANQYLVDAGGVGRATSAGLTMAWRRNQAGAAELRAGTPVIVCQGQISTLSLPMNTR